MYHHISSLFSSKRKRHKIKKSKRPSEMSGRGRGEKRGEHHNKQRVSVGSSKRNEGASAVGMTRIPGNNAPAANVTDPPTSPVRFGQEHIIPSSSIGLLLCHHNDQSQSSKTVWQLRSEERRITTLGSFKRRYYCVSSHIFPLLLKEEAT